MPGNENENSGRRSPELSALLLYKPENWTRTQHEEADHLVLMTCPGSPHAVIEKKTTSHEADIHRQLGSSHLGSSTSGILTCLGVFQSQDKTHIQMPACDTTLRNRMAEIIAKRKTNEPDYCKVVINFLKNMQTSLATLGKHNVLHRDIKPENIGYYADTDTFLLFDFGISSMGTNEVHSNAITKTTAYTVGYSAPELLSCALANQTDEEAAEASPKARSTQFFSAFSTDIYSIGAILSELLSHQEHILETNYQKNQELLAPAVFDAKNTINCLKASAEWMTQENPQSRPSPEEFNVIIITLGKLFTENYKNTNADDSDDNLIPLTAPSVPAI